MRNVHTHTHTYISIYIYIYIYIHIQFSHTDHWMFNMAPHGKELSEDLRIRIVALHKDGRGYKKFGNTLKLSYSTVARVIQRFSKTGFTRNRPRKGRSKKLSPRAVRQVQKLASKNRCMSAASIALEVAEVEGQLVSAQTICNSLQQVGLHGRRPRRKPLLKMAHKRFSKTGFTRNRPRKGRSKKLSLRAVRQVQKLASKNRCMSAASIALEVAEVEGQLVSAQTICNSLQQVGLHGRRPRRKPLLKLAHKKACKQFAEDNLAKSMNYWNHVLWSDESKVNLFDSDGVQHVWRRLVRSTTKILPCLQSSMVVVASWSGAAWVLLVLGSCGSLRETWIPTCYCDILKQKMLPSLQKLFSYITTTPNTPPRWQLPCCWSWWSGQVCLQTWTLLSTCGASSSRKWRSTMCLTSSSSVMSLWRSGRGCQQQPVQLWWIPCPGGLR